MLLSQDCVICQARSGDDILCADCSAKLKAIEIDPTTSCPQCAMPSPTGKRCGACLKAGFSFDKTVVCYAYRFPMDRLVSAYKFHGKVGLARWFADRLLDAVKQENGCRNEKIVDVIVPVPLHDNRIVERGYNQAWEIARLLSKKLGCESLPEGLSRVLDIKPQRELSKSARQTNPKGAFACRLDLTGKRVAIVDDVMTTGATLEEIASVLRAAGAISVVNWVIARTL